MNCLIFDGIADVDLANQIVAEVQQKFGLDAKAYGSDDQVRVPNPKDPRFPIVVYPWVLEPWIVLVPRPGGRSIDRETERKIEEYIESMGGNFAGT